MSNGIQSQGPKIACIADNLQALSVHIWHDYYIYAQVTAR